MINVILYGDHKYCIYFIKKILFIKEVKFYKFDLRVFFYNYNNISINIILFDYRYKRNILLLKKKIDILDVSCVFFLSKNPYDYDKDLYTFFCKKNVKIFFIFESNKINFVKQNFFIRFNKRCFFHIIKKVFIFLKNKKYKKNVFIPVIGFRGTGKTTLINTICKKEILSTSKSDENTKNISTFFVEYKNQKIIFFDFPGFKKSIKITKLKILGNSYKNVKIIIFLISIKINKKEKKVIEKLKKNYIVLICINKIDIVKKIENNNIYKRFFTCKVSAKKNINIKKLLNLIYKASFFMNLNFNLRSKKIRSEKFFIKKNINEKIIIFSKKKNKKKILKILKLKENLTRFVYSRSDSNR